MERLRERNDLDLLGAELLDRVAARQLQRCFVRFGAGVREERAIGESQVGQAFRETQHRFIRVAVADVPELLALIVQHLEQFGMRVAERRHRDAAGEVDVVAAVACPRCASRRRDPARNSPARIPGTITSSKVLRVTLMSVMANPRSVMTDSVGKPARYVLRIRDGFYRVGDRARASPVDCAIRRAWLDVSAVGAVLSGGSISAAGRGSSMVASTPILAMRLQTVLSEWPSRGRVVSGVSSLLAPRRGTVIAPLYGVDQQSFIRLRATRSPVRQNRNPSLICIRSFLLHASIHHRPVDLSSGTKCLTDE